MSNHALASEQNLLLTATNAYQCPACLATESKEWGKDRTLPIYKCIECDSLFFARPIEGINEYDSYYPYLQFFDQARADAELKIRTRQSQAKIRRIKSNSSNASLRLLDVGAGPGYFVKACLNSGIQAIGSELNADAIKFGVEKLGVSFQNLTECAPESFDVLTFFHVLEHLEKPDFLFSLALSALKKGGLVYIHVPVSEPMSLRLLWALKNFTKGTADRRGNLYFPDHVTGFSTKGIAAFSSRHGLEIIDVTSVSHFSPEYDPSFLVFEESQSKAMVGGIVETFYGGINLLGGGSWISLMARKL